MDIIEDECREEPRRIIENILQEWLEGKGMPRKWESLIKTLRETELPFQAKETAAKVSQSSSSMYVQYCSCQTFMCLLCQMHMFEVTTLLYVRMYTCMVIEPQSRKPHHQLSWHECSHTLSGPFCSWSQIRHLHMCIHLHSSL